MSYQGRPGPSDQPIPAGTGRGRGRLTRRGIFADKLPQMMYGAGDVQNPSPDTVAVMEEILVDYLSDICASAQPQLQPLQTHSRKLKLDDVRHALREPELEKQLGRVEELLATQKMQKRLRAQMDITGESLTQDIQNEGGGAGSSGNTGSNNGPPRKKK